MSPALKFSIMMSHLAISRFASAWPSGLEISIVTERLLRLEAR